MGMFDRAKQFYFDRSKVLDATVGATARVFSRFGAYTRQVARNSMKRKKGASKPGQPPHAHGKGLLKISVSFHYSPQERNVIIGPLPLPGAGFGVVPPLLEYGGMVPKQRNKRRRLRKLGGPGEIRLGGPKSKKNRDGKLVAYAKLRTAAQVRRANELNHQLYGPAIWPAFVMAKRPSMGPAFTAAKQKLPSMWDNVLAA